jgi:hypothetical protein
LINLTATSPVYVLWRCPPGRRPSNVVGNSFLFEVLENLLNSHRIFHTGYDLDRTTAFLTDLDVDIA